MVFKCLNSGFFFDAEEGELHDTVCNPVSSVPTPFSAVY